MKAETRCELMAAYEICASGFQKAVEILAYQGPRRNRLLSFFPAFSQKATCSGQKELVVQWILAVFSTPFWEYASENYSPVSIPGVELPLL